MMNVLNTIIENWALITTSIVGTIMVVLAIVKFCRMSAQAQKNKVKECLLAWVLTAEQELGGGTGEVKLRVVYTWFITAFPVFKVFVSFETFSKWVDEALDEMKDLLSYNDSIRSVVEDK